jgi:hypothetical protein
VCGALFAFLATTFAFAAPPLRAQTTAPASHPFAPPIQVFSCRVSSDTHNALLTVRFRNDSRSTLASILWRAKYGSGYIDFPDRGKFSPGATVVRRIPLFWRLFGSDPLKHGYAGFPFPENCTIIETKTDDGAEWGTPSNASDSVSIPTIPPDDATPIPASLDNAEHNPIGIIGCQYGVEDWRGYGSNGELRGHAMLYVRFRNLSTTAITRVTFRVPYASGGIDFVDGGLFAPGVLIKSDKRADEVMRKLSRDDLPLFPWAITSLDEAQNCTTVNVQFADGTTWQNPTVGPTQPPLPTQTLSPGK